MTAAALRVEPDVDTLPRRLWLVTLPDGTRLSCSFTPAATRAEVIGWYPGSSVEPEDDRTAVDAPAAPRLSEIPIPPPQRPVVACSACQHYAPSPTEGLGRCAVRRLVENHPASSPLPAWSDPMGKLLDHLARYRDGADAWPKSARGLGEVLRRQRPALAQIGISVEIGCAGKHGVPVTIRARRDGEHGEHGERRSKCGSLSALCDRGEDSEVDRI